MVHRIIAVARARCDQIIQTKPKRSLARLEVQVRKIAQAFEQGQIKAASHGELSANQTSLRELNGLLRDNSSPYRIFTMDDRVVFGRIKREILQGGYEAYYYKQEEISTLPPGSQGVANNQGMIAIRSKMIVETLDQLIHLGTGIKKIDPKSIYLRIAKALVERIRRLYPGDRSPFIDELMDVELAHEQGHLDEERVLIRDSAYDLVYNSASYKLVSCYLETLGMELPLGSSTLKDPASREKIAQMDPSQVQQAQDNFRRLITLYTLINTIEELLNDLDMFEYCLKASHPVKTNLFLHYLLARFLTAFGGYSVKVEGVSEMANLEGQLRCHVNCSILLEYFDNAGYRADFANRIREMRNHLWSCSRSLHDWIKGFEEGRELKTPIAPRDIAAGVPANEFRVNIRNIPPNTYVMCEPRCFPKDL